MKKLTKVMVLLSVIAVVLIIGLGLAVRSILTEDNIQQAVVARAEKSLGRKVAVGSISASLFSGITLQNFVVKEEDGVADFLTIRSVILQYDLGTLLDKQLQVNALKIEEPKISVIRKKDGSYNFSSLLDNSGEHNVNKTSTATLALPLALIVDTIDLHDIDINYMDADKQEMSGSVSGDFTIGGELAADLNSLTYKGECNLTVDAVYGEIKPKAKMSANFDQSSMQYSAVVTIGQEQALLQGEVVDYLANPEMILNVSSKQLNLKYLAGLASAFPKPDKAAVKIKDVSPNDSRQANDFAQLKVSGKVEIAKASYEKVQLTDLQADYLLQEAVLQVNNVKAKTAGGNIDGKLKLDIYDPIPVYQGEISGQSLDISTVSQMVAEEFAEVISGRLQTNVTFSGQGFEQKQIKQNLTMQTNYSLTNGQLQNTKLTEDLAAITGLPELRTLTFKDVTGKLKLLKGGKMLVDTALHNKDFSAKTDGTVDLEGKINLPVVVRVSPQMVEKIGHKDLSRYLAQENGETIVHLDVGGTLENPVVNLDQNYFKKVVHKAVVDQIFHHLDKIKAKKQGDQETGGEQDPQQVPIEPVLDLLNNFLGR